MEFQYDIYYRIATVESTKILNDKGDTMRNCCRIPKSKLFQENDQLLWHSRKVEASSNL
jgi:hypothetical protein